MLPMAETRPQPDPVVEPTPSAKQSVQKPSADRIKKISGGSPNFSGGNARTDGIPHPNNPYSK
jgi:hypothetical protein